MEDANNPSPMVTANTSHTTLKTGTRVSLRTLYRDIATLQAHGADIEGEAGVGYGGDEGVATTGSILGFDHCLRQ